MRADWSPVTAVCKSTRASDLGHAPRDGGIGRFRSVLSVVLATLVPVLGVTTASAQVGVPTVALFRLVEDPIPPAADKPLAELVMQLAEIELATGGDVSLVERAKLDALFREKEIAAAMGKESVLRAGGLVGADYLAWGWLAKTATPPAAVLHVRVAESKTGAIRGNSPPAFRKTRPEAVRARSRARSRTVLFTPASGRAWQS